ncbi:Protein involved in vacuole import and degradation, partial [Trachipleistophora hominis]
VPTCSSTWTRTRRALCGRALILRRTWWCFTREIEFLEFMSLFLDALKKESGFVGGDYGVVHGESAFKDIEKDAFDDADAYSFANECAAEQHTESESEEHEARPDGGDDAYNSLLYTDKDTAFVARGNTVGVFNTADRLTFNCSIKNVEGKKRKFLKKDNQLLFLDENRKDVKFLDLEKGRVVERIGLTRDVNDVMLRDSELLGMNDNSVFVVDSRTKGIGRDNTYKTKTYFTKGSTNGTFSAIGSVKGDLRVYKDVFKRARILVSGLGDEVLGIDIGNEYVILTFKNYLILFKIEERKNSRKVVRLQLRPEHVAFLKHSVSFTAAKFNTSNTDIITSTGQYVVTWRVCDVLNGNLYAYKMREYGSEVVDDSFVGEDRVLVTLKDDLKMLNKKNIK